MPGTDPDLIDDEIDPDNLDPADADLAKLEDGDDDDLDSFGEPPNLSPDEDEEFGRLRH